MLNRYYRFQWQDQEFERIVRVHAVFALTKTLNRIRAKISAGNIGGFDAKHVFCTKKHEKLHRIQNPGMQVPVIQPKRSNTIRCWTFLR